MKIIIFVRRHTGYPEDQIPDMKERGVFAKIRFLIESWNRSYKISWMQYRTKLFELSQESFKQTGCDIIINPAMDLTTESLEQLLSYSEIDLIIPTDDDDWFSPELSKYLCEIHSAELVGWRNLVIEIAAQKLWTRATKSGPLNTYNSNNYAIKVGTLKKLSAIDRSRILMTNAPISEIAINNSLAEISLESGLSCYIRHLSSVSYLQNFIDTSLDINDIVSCNAYKIDTESVPSKFDWATKYIIELNKLNQILISNQPLI